MADHARLSASSSERWMHCPPSVRLSEFVENRDGKEEASGFSLEGSEAHLYGEYKIRQTMGEKKLKNPVGKFKHYDEAMDTHTSDYASYVVELIELAKEKDEDAAWFLEQRVDFSEYVPGGFGTCDVVIVAGKTLCIIDFKYGAGVFVNAFMNTQLMLYALGALKAFDAVFEIENIRTTVYQPRKDNISSHKFTKAELLEWAEKEVKPRAALAESGDGKYRAGNWCQFCKAKGECRERANENLELAKHEFAEPGLLEDDEIASILGRLDALTAWANDVKKFALKAALAGRVFDGWKVVEGTSQRKITDESAAVKILQDLDVEPYDRKLKGIGALEKALGATRFAEVLKDYIQKPPGAPTLAPETDKRPSIFTSAEDDFKEDDVNV